MASDDTASVFVCKGYIPMFIATPCPQNTPILSDPLWASSASRKTVSMWQSSLKWKASRILGSYASFTKAGFCPFYYICQWLWAKAFETTCSSVLSDQLDLTAFGHNLRRFGVFLEKSPRKRSWSRGKKKGTAKGHPTAQCLCSRRLTLQQGRSKVITYCS